MVFPEQDCMHFATLGMLFGLSRSVKFSAQETQSCTGKTIWESFN